MGWAEARWAVLRMKWAELEDERAEVWAGMRMG